MVLFQGTAQTARCQAERQESPGCTGSSVFIRSDLLHEPRIPQEERLAHSREIVPPVGKEPAGRTLATEGRGAGMSTPPPAISILSVSWVRSWGGNRASQLSTV